MQQLPQSFYQKLIMIRNHQFKKFIVSAVALVVLAACGGGGGDSDNTPSPTANATLSIEDLFTASYRYNGIGVGVDHGAKQHLTDVFNAHGRTGIGVTIAIIDDFQQNSVATVSYKNVKQTRVPRANRKERSLTCEHDLEWDTNYTHGGLVQAIAGGVSPAGQRTLMLKPVLRGLVPADCVTFYEGINSDNLVPARLAFNAVPGVAPSATMVALPVLLGANAATTPADQTSTLIGHIQIAGNSNAQVINLSLGSNITAQTTPEEITAAIDSVPFNAQVTSVFTVAAGNDALPCADANRVGCNLMALMLAQNTHTRDATLVVGALDLQDKPTLYSTLAGTLKDRFIWASGETGFYGGARGTSYAAPRVAGAAALLREAHPSLTAQQISAILLLSANKDMFNDGNPFVGVSPMFGHGKLNLENAFRLAAHCAARSNCPTNPAVGYVWP